MSPRGRGPLPRPPPLLYGIQVYGLYDVAQESAGGECEGSQVFDQGSRTNAVAVSRESVLASGREDDCSQASRGRSSLSTRRSEKSAVGHRNEVGPACRMQGWTVASRPRRSSQGPRETEEIGSALAVEHRSQRSLERGSRRLVRLSVDGM